MFEVYQSNFTQKCLLFFFY